jgi:hypothetical protein
VLWDFFHLFVGLKGTLFSFLGYQGDFLHTFGRIFLNFWGARGFFFFFRFLRLVWDIFKFILYPPQTLCSSETSRSSRQPIFTN